MSTKRKTRAEREAERSELEREAWKVFKDRLAVLQTYDEAQKLVTDGPRPDAPGRRYYSNLAFFLSHDFTVPFGSSRVERILYMQFISRLDAAGALNPGGAKGVLGALESSLDISISG